MNEICFIENFENVETCKKRKLITIINSAIIFLIMWLHICFYPIGNNVTYMF